MSKPNFKSQAKRKRELAKLGKREAKDQKRALRKAERAEPGDPVVVPVQSPVVAGRPVPSKSIAPATPPPAPPMTLAAAVLRWKSTKVTKTKAR